jgi:hypothetical protein
MLNSWRHIIPASSGYKFVRRVNFSVYMFKKRSRDGRESGDLCLNVTHIILEQQPIFFSSVSIRMLIGNVTRTMARAFMSQSAE